MMVFAEVTSHPIDTARLMARVGAKEDGAVLLFVGVVRDHNDGRGVSGVGYEAYQEMAEKMLLDIATEAAGASGQVRVAVVHRVGELTIGEASVAIAVSSPHRAESYEASRYVIEEIKKRVPVWKHERYTDGTVDWVAGQAPEVVVQPTEGEVPSA
jgi:molybdopterin synthase catalytic subunit